MLSVLETMHAVAVLSAAATAQLSYFVTPSQASQDLHMQIVSFAHTKLSRQSACSLGCSKYLQWYAYRLVCLFLQMAPFSSSTGARCNPVLTQNKTTAAGDGNTAAASCTAADLSDTSAQMATAG